MLIDANIGYALRQVLRKKAFSAAVIGLLGISLAIMTAMFAIFDAVILRQFPYRVPENLVNILAQSPSGAGFGMNLREFGVLASEIQSLAPIAAYSPRRTLLQSREPRFVKSQETTAKFFDVLGVQPALGRVFRDGDLNVVVLDHLFWVNYFHADSSVIGTTFRLSERFQGENERVVTVIGVMPESFRYPPSPEVRSEVWLIANQNSDISGFSVLGRLVNDYPVAQAELTLQSKRLWPDNRLHLRPSLLPDMYVEGRGRVTYVFFVGSVLLMGVTILNLSHIFLIRALDSIRELGVRLALGASRSGVVLHVFTTASLYAILGAGLALILTPVSINLFVVFGQEAAGISPNRFLDHRILLVFLVTALLSSILVALLPVLVAFRIDLAVLMKSTLASRGQSRSSIQSMLLFSQVALAIVLVVGTVIFQKNLFDLRGTPLGFDSSSVLVVPQIEPTFPRAPDFTQRSRALQSRILEKLDALPGVEHAALIVPDLFEDQSVSPSKLSTLTSTTTLFLPGDVEKLVLLRFVSADFFQTLNIPLLKGRRFDDSDSQSGHRVAIVTNSLADDVWGEQDPLGRELRFGLDRPIPAEIVGLVPDVMTVGLNYNRQTSVNSLIETSVLPPVLYLNADQKQFPIPSYAAYLIRARGVSPQQLAPIVDRELRDVAGDMPLLPAKVLDDVLWGATSEARLRASVGTVLSLMATCLALIGVYSVTAYRAALSGKEIAIQRALGATSKDIFRRLGGAAGPSLLVGCILGVLTSAGVNRLLPNLVPGLKGIPFSIIGGVTAILALFSLVAILLPTLSAMRRPPTDGLRAL